MRTILPILAAALVSILIAATPAAAQPFDTLRIPTYLGAQINAIEISPVDNTFIVGGYIATYGFESGQRVRQFRIEDMLSRDVTTQGIRYYPDGQQVIVTNLMNGYKYEVSNGIASLPLQKESVFYFGQGLDISDDGRMIAASCTDQAVRIWSAATGSLIRKIPGPYWRGLDFSPDGKHLIVDTELYETHLLDVETGERLRVITETQGSTTGWTRSRYSPDGSIIAFQGGTRPEITLYDAASGAEIGVLGGAEDHQSRFSFSRDGRYLIAPGVVSKITYIWDVVNRELVRRFAEATDHIHSAAISNDGDIALTGTRGGDVWLWKANLYPTGVTAGGEQASSSMGSIYPNPASTRLVVPLKLEHATDVRVTLSDIFGREVAIVAEGPLAAGRHDLAFDTSTLPPGTYTCASRIAERIFTGRVLVVR